MGIFITKTAKQMCGSWLGSVYGSRTEASQKIKSFELTGGRKSQKPHDAAGNSANVEHTCCRQTLPDQGPTGVCNRNTKMNQIFYDSFSNSCFSKQRRSELALRHLSSFMKNVRNHHCSCPPLPDSLKPHLSVS